ncbi:unnamed protein product [Somion occarium]|uniref:Uncharacterized protein n=1 Tax=Somion occarium TaxID=3059160 RepID=A0ABP1DI24_9APHY
MIADASSGSGCVADDFAVAVVVVDAVVADQSKADAVAGTEEVLALQAVDIAVGAEHAEVQPAECKVAGMQPSEVDTDYTLLEVVAEAEVELQEEVAGKVELVSVAAVASSVVQDHSRSLHKELTVQVSGEQQPELADLQTIEEYMHWAELPLQQPSKQNSLVVLAEEEEDREARAAVEGCMTKEQRTDFYAFVVDSTRITERLEYTRQSAEEKDKWSLLLLRR